MARETSGSTGGMDMVPLVSVVSIQSRFSRLGGPRRPERPPAGVADSRGSLRPLSRLDLVCIEFSVSTGDAPCPSCGQLLWLHELRWPFVCEDQGLPLRGKPTRRHGPSLARRIGLIIHPGRPSAAGHPAGPRPRPSTSAMLTGGSTGKHDGLGPAGRVQ